MTYGDELVAEMSGRAIRALQKVQCPLPEGAALSALAEAARAWKNQVVVRDRALLREVGALVDVAADVLEAAGACSGPDPLAAGIVLGGRFGALEAILSGVPLAWAKDRQRRRRAGRQGRKGALQKAMNDYGAAALKMAVDIIAEGRSKSVASVIKVVRQRWPEDVEGLPGSDRAIINLIGNEVRRLLKESMEVP